MPPNHCGLRIANCGFTAKEAWLAAGSLLFNPQSAIRNPQWPAGMPPGLCNHEFHPMPHGEDPETTVSADGGGLQGTRNTFETR